MHEIASTELTGLDLIVKVLKSEIMLEKLSEGKELASLVEWEKQCFGLGYVTMDV